MLLQINHTTQRINIRLQQRLLQTVIRNYTTNTAGKKNIKKIETEDKRKLLLISPKNLIQNMDTDFTKIE